MDGEKVKRGYAFLNEMDDGPSPDMLPFNQFIVWLDGLDYTLTREELQAAYRSSDWRSAVRAVPQAPMLPGAEADHSQSGVWGFYKGDDSLYNVADVDLDPVEELAIMAREDREQKNNYFGPWGSFPG